MGLSIGDVARRAGVSVDTVRYYERESLIPNAERSPGGQRVFPDDILDAFEIISALRAAGFGIADIRKIMGLKGVGTVAERMDRVVEVCAEFDRALDEREIELQKARKVVAQMRDEATEVRNSFE